MSTRLCAWMAAEFDGLLASRDLRAAPTQAQTRKTCVAAARSHAAAGEGELGFGWCKGERLKGSATVSAMVSEQPLPQCNSQRNDRPTGGAKCRQIDMHIDLNGDPVCMHIDIHVYRDLRQQRNDLSSFFLDCLSQRPALQVVVPSAHIAIYTSHTLHRHLLSNCSSTAPRDPRRTPSGPAPATPATFPALRACLGGAHMWGTGWHTKVGVDAGSTCLHECRAWLQYRCDAHSDM